MHIVAKHTAPYMITTLRAGTLLGQSEMAVLHAPRGTPRGGLHPLTRFLSEHGIKMLPGHGDSPKEHVLRLSHFGTQERLLDLLKHQFAPWYEQHYGQQGDHPPITISPDLTCEVLAPTSYETMASRLLGEQEASISPKAGPLAGMLYGTGNLNLLLSALSHRNEEGKLAPKKLQALTALSYVTSSVILMLHSGKPVDAQSLDVLFDDLERKELPREAEEILVQNKGFFKDTAHKVVHIIQNHPWEATALINSAGTLSFFVNKVREQSALGMLGAALGLGSIAVRLLPTRGRESLIDFHGIVDKLENNTSLIDRGRNHLSAGGFFGTVLRTAETMLGWIRENKLFTSGLMSAASSVGYLLSGLLNKDWGLFRTSLLYLAANGSQALASESPAHTLGDVGFAVASYTDHLKTEIPAMPKSVLQWKAHDLSTQLPPYYEVIHDDKQIYRTSQNMTSMLTAERQALLLEPSDAFLQHYAKNESHLLALKHNPFLPVVSQQETAAFAAQTATL